MATAPIRWTAARVRELPDDGRRCEVVDGQKPSTWSDVRRLLVAVEILSPSSARDDREIKRQLYRHEHVPEYWIVDVDTRIVERWRSEDELGIWLAGIGAVTAPIPRCPPATPALSPAAAS